MSHEESTNKKSFADLGYCKKHLEVLRDAAKEFENEVFPGVITSLPTKYPLPAHQSMGMNQNWVDKALQELFAGQAKKLNSISPPDRNLLCLAVWKYAEDLRDVLKSPATDPVAALFGHCNKLDESQAAVRLIISWGVDPGDIPLLRADEAAEAETCPAAEQPSLFEPSQYLPMAAA